jgi:hypothetical protein
MQKVIAVFCISVFLAMLPQTGHAQHFVGGLKGGLTASEVSGDQLGGPNKAGWFAAVFTNISTGSFSRLQLELMYIQKGSRSVPTERNDFYSYKFYLQYVEIPLVYAFDFAAFELPFARRLTAEAGLSLSILVDHHEEVNELVLDLSDIKPFHGSELNLLLGLSYPLGESLGVNFRFSQGVTPLRPHEGGSTVWYNRGQYNTVWSLGLSYTFF